MTQVKNAEKHNKPEQPIILEKKGNLISSPFVIYAVTVSEFLIS